MQKKKVLKRCMKAFCLGTLMKAPQAYAFRESLEANFEGPQKTSLNMTTGFNHLDYYHGDFNQGSYLLDVKLKRKMNTSVDFKLDSFAQVKMYGEGKTTYSLREIYFDAKFSKDFSWQYGRKIKNWTAYENYKSIGAWNNSWDYNKVAPQREGLLGVYFGNDQDQFLKKGFRFFVFASPVSIPKMTEHYQFGNQEVSPLTPWFKSPPEEITYEGNKFRTSYELNVDEAELILSPQLGFSVGQNFNKFYFNSSYYYGPDKDLDMAIDFSLSASQPDTPVEVSIRPVVSYVHKIAGDLSYKWSEGRLTTLSLNYRKRNRGLPKDIYDKESYIGLSSGGTYQVFHQESLFKQRLRALVHFTENTDSESQVNGELGQTLLDSLSVPFRFRRGVGLDLEVKGSSLWSFSLYNYWDFKLNGLLGSFKVSSNRKKLNYSLSYTYVEAFDGSSEGFYKDFRENDAVNLGLNYVF